MKILKCKSNNSSKIASFVDSMRIRLNASNKSIERYSITINASGRTSAIIYYS